jgi:hypothetical protein
MTLIESIKSDATKASIVQDCTVLIDQQVAAKGGMSGLALKTAYKIVKGVGPTYIPGAIGRLLPEVMKALDPMWQEGLQAGNPVDYLTQNSAQTADTILSVTDNRIKNSSGVVRSSYNKLRNSVKGDVEAAVPELAKIIGKHTQVSQQV